MKRIRFQNQDCVVLENTNLQLIISESIGPRILGLRFQGGENLLAELPDFTTYLPDGLPYYFYGGHRLWAAPEIMPSTYDPDDNPVEISSEENIILVKKEKEKFSDLEKSLKIQLDPEKPIVTIEHVLKNCGSHTIECAPWAITQLRTGGTAILPLRKDDTGFLPNRSISFWPYTDINHPKIKWGNEYILIDADMESPFKVGYPNPSGWIGYWLDGVLFVKFASYDPDKNYYDFNSSSECYCNDRFIELESLGSKLALGPQESITHKEVWKVFSIPERPENEDLVKQLQKIYKFDQSM